MKSDHVVIFSFLLLVLMAISSYIFEPVGEWVKIILPVVICVFMSSVFFSSGEHAPVLSAVFALAFGAPLEKEEKTEHEKHDENSEP